MASAGRGDYPFSSTWWHKVQWRRRGLTGIVKQDAEGAGQSVKTDFLFESSTAGAGASDGVATVSGVGAALGSGVAASAGVGAASGVGKSTADAAGTSSGVVTASGIGSAYSAAVGSSAGVATASGVGDYTSTAGSVGASAGTATALGVGASTSEAVGASSGAAVATGVGSSEGGDTEDTHDGFSTSDAKALREYLTRRKQKPADKLAAKTTAAPAPETSPQTTEPAQNAEPASSPPFAPVPDNSYHRSILAEIDRLNTALSDLAQRQIAAARQELADLERARAAELATTALLLIQDHEADEDDEDDLMLLMSI